MAKVYLAESLASGLKKLVVLKVLNQNLAADAGMRSAFLREAELSARMNHPNVVQVLEVVEHAISPVMVMEYLDGMSLSRYSITITGLMGHVAVGGARTRRPEALVAAALAHPDSSADGSALLP